MNPDRIYTFKCPECQRVFSYDEPGEPMCDGPNDVREHEPAVMRRIKVRDKTLGEKLVSEAEGEARAKGTLLTPENIVSLKLRVKGKLWSPKDGLDPWTKEEIESDD